MIRSQIISVVAIWVVAGVLIVTGAIDPAHAALLAACISAAVFVRLDQPAESPILPSLPTPKHAGAHGDLSAMAWGMYDVGGSVSSRPLARIRALAAGLPNLQAAIDSCPHPSEAQVKGWLKIIERAQGASIASH